MRMTRRKLGSGFTIITIIQLIFIIGYGYNIVRLCKADFEPSYKNEIIRGIGIVMPPVGVVVSVIDLED